MSDPTAPTAEQCATIAALAFELDAVVEPPDTFREARRVIATLRARLTAREVAS